LEPLAALAKEARGKDWYMMVRPQHASGDAKAAFLKRYFPQWEMLMQRRDSEGHTTHDIRYAKFDLYRSVLQGLAEDTQSLKCWFRSPRDDAGYQVDFEVAFIKGSKSAKAIRSLVPPRSRIVGHPEDALASIACNACLPDKVKSLLQASVPVLNSSLLGILAQQAADSEVLNGHLNVQNLSGSSSLVATGQFPWLPAKRLEDIAAILDEATVEKRKLTFPSPIGIGEVPYVVSAHLKNRSTRCDFSIEQTPSEAPPRTDKVGSPRTLLSAYVNFKTLASDSGNGDARQLLELFEKVYDSHITTVTGVDSVTVRPQEMKSVLPMLSGEGDWTARLSVVVIGNRGLRIRLRVGRELYGLFDARMRRSRDARKRSLGG
jgi:hypothetical protein